MEGINKDKVRANVDTIVDNLKEIMNEVVRVSSIINGGDEVDKLKELMITVSIMDIIDDLASIRGMVDVSKEEVIGSCLKMGKTPKELRMEITKMQIEQMSESDFFG